MTSFLLSLAVELRLLATFIFGGLWHGAGWTFVFWGFLHGLALVIHKIWNQLGFKMNTLLAWFITFNFINISWVFFRAKEWDDALKVLNAMFSLDYIILPGALASKLVFFKEYGIEFGYWLDNIQGSIWTPIWLIIILFITLHSKNSIEQLYSLKLNYKSSLFTAVLFSIGVLSLSKVSEFLYFNF